jgi:hypothetical protein
MATSTSATILITATTDRCQNAGSRLSAVFVQTRRTMSMATQALPGMTGVANTTPAFREEDIPVEAVTREVEAVTAKGIGCEKGPATGGPFSLVCRRFILGRAKDRVSSCAGEEIG